MNSFVIGFLKERKIKYEERVDLSKVSTVKIGPIADLVTYPETADSMVDLLSFLERSNIVYVVIGRLSNTLFVGKSYHGIVVSTKLQKSVTVKDNIATFACGLTIASAFSMASKYNLGGAEPLWLIPGSIGASILGNAGAHGLELCDIVKYITVYDPEVGVASLTADEIFPTYRSTALKNSRATILSATFALIEKNREDILSEVIAYKNQRERTQPIELPSLGSTFKRVDGVSAGYYIDKAGLKGMSVGGAMVSNKHAGFIVNVHNASADDYLALVELVKRTVYDRMGVRLEEEIKVLR